MLKYWLPHSISKILRLYVTQKSMGIELYTIRCLCKKKKRNVILWKNSNRSHLAPPKANTYVITMAWLWYMYILYIFLVLAHFSESNHKPTKSKSMVKYISGYPFQKNLDKIPWWKSSDGHNFLVARIFLITRCFKISLFGS